MKHLLNFYLILSLMLFVACEEGNVELDNAGDEFLYVTVDELRHDMAPHSMKLLELKKGRHKILITDREGKTLEEETFEVNKGGVLNVSKHSYIVWTDLYWASSEENSKLRETKLQEEALEIDGQEYVGEFLELDAEQLYIESEWDYGLREEFPASLWGLEFAQEKWSIKRKIFRKKELAEAYMKLVKR